MVLLFTNITGMRVAHRSAGHSALLSCKHCLTLTPCLDCLTAYCPLLADTHHTHRRHTQTSAMKTHGILTSCDSQTGQWVNGPVAGQTLGITVVCTPLFSILLTLPSTCASTLVNQAFSEAILPCIAPHEAT